MTAGSHKQHGVSMIEILVAFAATTVFIAFTIPGAPGLSRNAKTARSADPGQIPESQLSVSGITVACQATTFHSPPRFTNVPVLKYSVTPGETPCFLPTSRNATTAESP